MSDAVIQSSRTVPFYVDLLDWGISIDKVCLVRFDACLLISVPN